MREYIFILLISSLYMFFPHSAKAQSLSIASGYNLANMKTNAESNYESINGFHVGLNYDYPVSELLSVESGIRFSRKGRKQSSSIAGMDLLSTKINLDYLEVPMLLRFSKSVQPGVKAYIKGGPYLGAAIGGKVERTSGLLGMEVNVKDDIYFGTEENETKRWDYGLNIGAGIEISNVILEVGYGFGLANTSNKTDETMNHRVANISVGYNF